VHHISARHPHPQPPPRELHETLAGARAEQTIKTWKTKDALRAGIEGTINRVLDLIALRRAR
jgi:hypothetical protein